MWKENVKKYRIIMVCILLVVSTLAIYWQVKDYGFVSIDDPYYVTDNTTVKKGLGLEGLSCAFTACSFTEGIGHWHPLTWLSLMLDYQLYGLNAAGYHITNVLFHIANTLLLFLILNRMTRAVWRSAFVAALFALHPLHVESVAWVTERKDVLSTFFGLLTIGTYLFYVEKPGIKRYLPVLILFTLGLMAKSMLVTLPFVLLLLDFWPLGRMNLATQQSAHHGNDQKAPTRQKLKKSKKKSESPASAKASSSIKEAIHRRNWSPVLPLIREKFPLLVLSVMASLVAYYAAKQADGIGYLMPYGLRIENTFVSYISYIIKMLWPTNLGVLYPYPDMIPLWQTAGAAFILASITASAVLLARRMPYFMVGWLWYLGTLVPVIGIVTVGSQAMADRYTYVPMIGLFIMISWSVADLTSNLAYKKIINITLSTITLASLTAVTWKQLQYWNNSISLYEHTLRATTDNWFIHNSLGAAYRDEGKFNDAIAQYNQSVRIKPEHAQAWSDLGIVLRVQGRVDEALSFQSRALQIDPKLATAHCNLGSILASQNRLDEAIAHFQQAIQAKPRYTEAYINWGDALTSQGKAEEAVPLYRKAIEIKPDAERAHHNLGTILAGKGETDEAIIHFEEALRIRPNYARAYNSLGNAYMKKGSINEAISQYRKALSILPDFKTAEENLKKALSQQKKGSNR